MIDYKLERIGKGRVTIITLFEFLSLMAAADGMVCCVTRNPWPAVALLGMCAFFQSVCTWMYRAKKERLEQQFKDVWVKLHSVVEVAEK